MERTPIVSKTGMCGYAYDPTTETLEIAFKPNKEGDPERVYQYSAFKQADWEAFLASESKGSHLLKAIKPKFTGKKIEPEKPRDG